MPMISTGEWIRKARKVYDIDVFDESGELLISHGSYCDRGFDMYDASLVSDIVGFEVRTEAARAA